MAATVADRIQFGFTRRLELQKQTESAECGLACLAMLASFHGHQTDLPTLRKRFPLSLKGATLEQVVDIAAALKLIARPLRLELDEVAELALPCILHWDLNHFVVLQKLGKGFATILDPARGVRRLSLDELSSHFTGIAVEFSPAPGFQKKIERQQLKLRALMGHVVGLKTSLFQIFILALALELFSLLAPLFNQWVVDQVILTGDLDLLLTLALGFGLLKIAAVATEAARGWAVLVMSTTLNVQWLANLFSHLLQLPISFFAKRQTGDIVSRFNSIHAIQATLTTSFIGAILDGLMAIGTITMMLVYSPTLAMIGIIAMLLYCLLRTVFHASLTAATDNALVHDATQQTLFLESLRGMQSIRLFGKEKDRLARWLNVVVAQKNATLRTQRLALIFQTGNGLLFGLEGILVIALGAKMVIANEFSVGMLFAFLAYKTQFSSRVSGLIDKFFELKMLRLQAERLSDIALTAPEKGTPHRAHDVTGLEASIETAGLSFGYGIGEKPVLHNINLRIEAGETVALVGPSGCGKTTLVKLLLGINTPTAGTIKIGGVPLAQIGLANYRNLIGTVMQDDTLFSGTIADNVSFFAAAEDHAWLEQCCKMAAIHDDILAMPMGYGTLVGDMGSTLSGGQKQRVLLARALYRKPKILFLDEATSHLDPASEQAVIAAVRKLSITRVIVAHRSDTIAGADRVIRLGVPALPTPSATSATSAQHA